jgi:hypothetical protein
MLTIFTIPKAFKEKTIIPQRNAILSWLQLFPKCEIILFGDDEGVAKTAKELNIINVPEIKKSSLGTPLLSSAIDLARKLAKNDLLMYVNADIILMSDFLPALQKVKNQPFLFGGQRCDLDVPEEIDFKDQNWENKLREKIRSEGKLHGPTGLDYFVIPRSLPDILKMPPLIVGRPGWDNWLIYRALLLKIPVIDTTNLVTVVHQNHDYSHSPYGNLKKRKVMGPETQANIKMIGGFANMSTFKSADFVLTPAGVVPKNFLQRLLIKLSLTYPWRMAMVVKRKLQFKFLN